MERSPGETLQHDVSGYFTAVNQTSARASFASLHKDAAFLQFLFSPEGAFLPVRSTFKSLLTPNTTDMGRCGARICRYLHPLQEKKERKLVRAATRLRDNSSKRRGMKDGTEEGSHTYSGHSAHLLVCQHRAALEWRQVAGEQGSARPVVFTEDRTIDVMETVPRH